MSEDEKKREQAVGRALPEWSPCEPPPQTPLEGRTCRLLPLRAAEHTQELYEEFSKDAEGGNWTYLGYGPFASQEEFASWVQWAESLTDTHFFTVKGATSERALGVASFLRVEPSIGVIEIGHIHFSPALQGTTGATEALYLMMRRIFDELGYRRCEWKCDSLNEASIRAAKRLGFEYEGTFRQATIYKGRNRDTAWFSILDSEWPTVRQGLETWLDPSNFGPDGAQRRDLASLQTPRNP